jgi:ABC-type Mn2+/Zn2+ transport system ATPase subunit
LDQVSEIKEKQEKEKRIIQYLSQDIFLNMDLSLSVNYILRMTIDMAAKLEFDHVNKAFCSEVKRCLKNMSQFLKLYQGDNNALCRLMKVKSKLVQFEK